MAILRIIAIATSVIPAIDRRVRETYIRNSQARKTKAYDLYARFLRWASDRLGENGIIAFVSNNSFIDARTYDGLRKVIAEEFNEIYIINLKGNARTSGDRGIEKEVIYLMQYGSFKATLC
nr:hypothetical protein [Chroococcidiopsis sp. SAG 2025]